MTSVIYLFFISTVEGVVLRSELRHLRRWQIHRDGIRRQEGNSVRGHLLKRKQSAALPQHFYWDDFYFDTRTTDSRPRPTEELNWWKSMDLFPKDAYAGKKLTFFCPFLEVYFWVALFFLLFPGSPLVRIFGCNLLKQCFVFWEPSPDILWKV